MNIPAAALPSDGLRREDRTLVDLVWDVFRSLRTALWLMGLLACGAALGSLLNPGPRPLSELRATIGHEWWYPLYRFLELDSPFHAWWFVLLLVLLALSLAAAAIDRLPGVIADVLRPEKRLGESVLALTPQVLRLEAKAPPAEAAAEVAALLRARGFEPEILEGQGSGKEGTAAYVFAERGRYSRFGGWVVHLSLFLILGGALVGRLLGVEGVASVPMDGGTFDYLVRRTSEGSAFKEPLGFRLRVDGFRVLKYGDGNPRSLESDLEVLDGAGKVILQKTIRVGDPLRYAGWTFYQASYEEEPGRDEVKLAVTDLSQVGAPKMFLLGKDADAALPDGVHFQVANYTADYQRLGPAVQIVRAAPGGHKTSFWVFQNYPDFDAKNRGDKYGLRLDGVEPFYFTGLQIARDPGYPLWLTGCCLLLLGLAIAYHSSHRRLWARASADGELVLGGVAHKNRAAFEEAFAELAAALRKARV